MRAWALRGRREQRRPHSYATDLSVDTRPSADIARAIHTLRRGHSIEATAKATGLPEALVELIARDSTPPRAVSPRQVAIITAIALINIAVDLCAATLHSETLGAISGITAAGLTLAVFKLARRLRLTSRN